MERGVAVSWEGRKELSLEEERGLSVYGRGGLLSVGKEAGRRSRRRRRERELLEYGRGFCRLGGEEGGGGGRRRGCQDPREGRRSKASNQRIKNKNRIAQSGNPYATFY